MAKAITSSATAEGGKESRPPSFILLLLILTVIGAGAGFGAATFLPQLVNPPPAPAVAQEKPAEPGKPIKATRFPADAIETALKPIVVNAGTENPRMVRFESSIIVAGNTPGVDVLKSEVEEDIVAFMKGVNISETFSVRGFQNMRDDLDDRARIRGRGAILGLLINGFVFE